MKALLVAIGAAAVAGPAAAQAPDTTRTDSARILRPVEVTESRGATTVGGTSAVVITPMTLRSSPAPLLEQALRESPFIHVRQNSRGEMELSVRGSDSRQAAVILDGVPLSLGWDHRVDPSLVPITGAQNLVIVRGLGSVLGGPNTLGGIIEVSHDDAFGRLGDGRAWGGVGVDENAAYVTSLGGGRDFTSMPGGTLSMRGGFALRQRDGFTLPAGAPDPTATRGLRTNSDLREADGFASLRWSGAMGRALGLTITGFEAERGVPPEEHVSDPRLWRYPYHRRLVAALSGSAGTFATPFGYGTFEVGGGVNAGRLRIDSYTDRSYSSVEESELGHERTLTGRARFGHTLRAGAKLSSALTVADVNYVESLPGDPPVEYQQRLWSAGVEVEAPLFSSTRLATGVVYDRSATPRAGGRPLQDPFDNVGWRAGLTHDLNAHWRLHTSASSRSRFPALRELYSGALDRFLPNPDLRPERLLGLEAGFTMDRAIGPVPDATLQVNAFHHDLKDAVVRTTLPDPDNRLLRVNRDRIRSTGLEVLAGLALGSDRERAVTITGDALIQRITISDQTSPGPPPHHAENNPETRGMVEAGVPLPFRIRGFANARYTGRQYCLNADTDAEMTLPPRVEQSLAAERRFTISRGGAFQSLRALVALDNAGNATIYDQCGLPQPGRTLRLMFTLQ